MGFFDSVPPMVRAKLEDPEVCGINPAIIPAIAAIVAAAVPVAQGAARNASTKNIRKRNDQRIEELEGLERSGQLGLSPEQQRLLSSRLTNPIAAGATAGRQRQEELIAGGASGGSAGAALASLRQEQQRFQGQAQLEAQLAFQQVQEQARLEQQNELERRLAAQAVVRARNADEILGPINQATSQFAQSAGALAGAPPATGNLLRGGPQGSPPQTQADVANRLLNQGYTPDQVDQLLAIFTRAG